MQLDKCDRCGDLYHNSDKCRAPDALVADYKQKVAVEAGDHAEFNKNVNNPKFYSKEEYVEDDSELELVEDEDKCEP